MMGNFRFADPYFFILLLSIIPLWLTSKRTGGRIKFSQLAIFYHLKNFKTFNPRWPLLVLRSFVIIFFILALARPQAGKNFRETSSLGVDIMLVVDTSESMLAMDFKKDGEPVDRLVIVKDVVRDFIMKRPGDRLGLIVFDEEAYTQCPLTLDHGIVLEFLKKIEIGMAGGKGTAIGSALGTSVKRMKDLDSKSKIVILLTDGSNNSGSIPPLKASELAKKFGIKVYTIGVGTKGKAPFLMDTIFGKRYHYQEVDMDEGMLKEIAKTTNASYFRATDKRELEDIYTQIDKLEKTHKKVKEYTEYNELFSYFLLTGILILLIEIVLSLTILRKIP